VLLQLRQDAFDLIEVRQLARVVAGFGVADDALLPSVGDDPLS
jgi:hypothetical protein